MPNYQMAFFALLREEKVAKKLTNCPLVDHKNLFFVWLIMCVLFMDYSQVWFRESFAKILGFLNVLIISLQPQIITTCRKSINLMTSIIVLDRLVHKLCIVLPAHSSSQITVQSFTKQLTVFPLIQSSIYDMTSCNGEFAWTFARIWCKNSCMTRKNIW